MGTLVVLVGFMFSELWFGDVHTAGKHVVPTVVLTLEFCQDWLENPHGAHVFSGIGFEKSSWGPCAFLGWNPPKKFFGKPGGPAREERDGWAGAMGGRGGRE